VPEATSPPGGSSRRLRFGAAPAELAVHDRRRGGVEPDGPLYRLGRQPDPWAWPDWSYAGPDGTFGNRYDDPEASYRALYASSQRIGTFLETLARFRPDLEVLAELEQIEGDDEPSPPCRTRGW
jgi:RES domain